MACKIYISRSQFHFYFVHNGRNALLTHACPLARLSTLHYLIILFPFFFSTTFAWFIFSLHVLIAAHSLTPDRPFGESLPRLLKKKTKKKKTKEKKTKKNRKTT